MTIGMKKNLLGRPRAHAECPTPLMSTEIPVSPFCLDERGTGDVSFSSSSSSSSSSSLFSAGQPHTPTFKLRRSQGSSGHEREGKGDPSSDGLLESLSSFTLPSAHSHHSSFAPHSHTHTLSLNDHSTFNHHRSPYQERASSHTTLHHMEIMHAGRSAVSRGRSMSMFERLDVDVARSPPTSTSTSYDSSLKGMMTKKKKKEEEEEEEGRSSTRPSHSSMHASSTASTSSTAIKPAAMLPKKDEKERLLKTENSQSGDVGDSMLVPSTPPHITMQAVMRADEERKENDKGAEEKVVSPMEGRVGRRRTFSVHDIILQSKMMIIVNDDCSLNSIMELYY